MKKEDWISVEDRLPNNSYDREKDGRYKLYLVTDGKRCWEAEMYYFGMNVSPITHWQEKVLP